MTDSNLFNALHLTTIPLLERDSLFDNKFILAGNLDGEDRPRDLTNNPAITPFLATPYPFKVQFSMTHLCLRGTMRVKLNLCEYELQRNSLLIVTPGSIGQCLEMSPDCRLILVAVSKEFLFTEEDSEAALIVRKYLSQQSLLHLNDTQVEEFLSIYRALRTKLRQPEFRFKPGILKGYMQVLYYELCQLMVPFVEQQNTMRLSRKKQIFDRFIEVLRQHYASERSISFYADRLCLTPKYLSQVVYAVSGRHAGKWIRDYVILEAKALLKSGQYTIQQVSDMLNFANQSFFGVYFKKAVGCSPTAYKEM